MKQCNAQSKYPEERVLRRFIRDATACLQAIVGTEISNADATIAARMICDVLPILRDPKPAAFPSSKRFPYWVIIIYFILFSMTTTNLFKKNTEFIITG